jgi:hypothetical protein
VRRRRLDKHGWVCGGNGGWQVTGGRAAVVMAGGGGSGSGLGVVRGVRVKMELGMQAKVACGLDTG